MSRRWPDAVVRWVVERYPDYTNPELSEMICDELGVEMTAQQLNGFARNHGLRKTPEAFARRARNARYTDEWREWFKGFVPGHSEREISDECERVWGFPMTEGMVANWKRKLGVKSGTHGGRFAKGQVSHNKGKTWDEFMSKEAQERVRASGNLFAKGNLSGYALAHRRPVGYERVDKEGYTWVKVKDGLQDSANDNFQPKHRVVWERHNGPVPEGHMVVFLDGDRTNFDPSNLALESRSEHATITCRKLDYWDGESHEAARTMANIMGKRRELLEKLKEERR